VSVSLTAQAAIENATKEFEEGVIFAGFRVAGGQGQRQMSGEGGESALRVHQSSDTLGYGWVSH